MKKFIPFLSAISLLFSAMVNAQSLDRSVIGAAGNFLVKENLILSFTVGETAVSAISKPTLIVTEGFHQSGIQELIAGTDEIIFINGLQVYPNPTGGLLNLGLPIEDPFDLSYALFDALGKKVSISNLPEPNSNQYQLDLTGLPAGLYLLVVGLDNSEVSKTFKVQKIP